MKNLMKSNKGECIIWLFVCLTIAVIMFCIKEYEGVIFFVTVSILIAIVLPMFKQDGK